MMSIKMALFFIIICFVFRFFTMFAIDLNVAFPRYLNRLRRGLAKNENVVFEECESESRGQSNPKVQIVYTSF